MKTPSKTFNEFVRLRNERDQIIHELGQPDADVSALTADLQDVLAQMRDVQALPDVFTCVVCGKDFEQGIHLELCVAAITTFDEAGQQKEHIDFSMHDARRLKVCGECFAEWTDPFEYVEVR